MKMVTIGLVAYEKMYEMAIMISPGSKVKC